MSKRFLLSVAILLATFNIHSQNLHAQEASPGNIVRDALCSNDADCDDQNPCTQEACFIGGPQGDRPQGICVGVLNPNPNPNCEVPPPNDPSCDEFPGKRCCVFQFDCDDGDFNTEDICVSMEGEGGYCENPPLPLCDDNDPCTRDERISQTACSFIRIEGCPAPETQPTLPPVEAPPAVTEEPPAPAVTPTPEYMFGSGCALGASSLNPWMTWILFSPILAMWVIRKKN